MPRSAGGTRRRQSAFGSVTVAPPASRSRAGSIADTSVRVVSPVRILAPAEGREPGAHVGRPIFAIGRIPGWTVQAMERRENNILIRPRLLYTGPDAREYVPIEARGRSSVSSAGSPQDIPAGDSADIDRSGTEERGALRRSAPGPAQFDDGGESDG